jgi:hypothetical protein
MNRQRNKQQLYINLKNIHRNAKEKLPRCRKQKQYVGNNNQRNKNLTGKKNFEIMSIYKTILNIRIIMQI